MSANVSKRNSGVESNDDDDGLLFLPEPAADHTYVQPIVPNSEKQTAASADSNESNQSQSSGTAKNTTAVKQGTTSAVAEMMVEKLSDRVFGYICKEMLCNCSATIYDSEEEFSKRAVGLDTKLELKKQSKVYTLFSQDFRAWGLRLIRMHRVKNVVRYSNYEAERKLLLNHRGSNYNLNEKYLYLGTQEKSVDSILDERLPTRLLRVRNFGEGYYFSDSPLKAFMDSLSCADKVKFDHKDVKILVCRVFLGDMKVYKNHEVDVNLNRGPIKEEKTAGGKKEYYDSVYGRSEDLAEYVVYQPNRFYVEFVIEVSENLEELRKFVENILQRRDRPTMQSMTSITGSSQDSPKMNLFDSELGPGFGGIGNQDLAQRGSAQGSNLYGYRNEILAAEFGGYFDKDQNFEFGDDSSPSNTGSLVEDDVPPVDPQNDCTNEVNVMRLQNPDLGAPQTQAYSRSSRNTLSTDATPTLRNQHFSN